MQINHNIAAMNAWRNLGASNAQLGKSLEKLSSGYRINRGADDPAGLLISEQLRAQISGLDQAVKNASDAISMVQTAEGALTEMNNMLNSIRSLAVHAANTGSNDSNSIAADQTAVDKAVESMQRIATTTKYAGKNLLDGSAGTAIDVLAIASTKLSSVVVGQVGQSGQVSVNVTTIASAAVYTGNLNASGGVFAAGGVITLWSENCGVAGTAGVYTTTLNSTTTTCIAAMINSDSATTKVWASTTGGSDIAIYSCAYGDAQTVRFVADAQVGCGAVNFTDVGQNIVASIGGEDLRGSGLVVTGSSTGAWLGTHFNVASDANLIGAITNALSIVTGNLQFSLTEDASTGNLISYSIADMRTSKLGVVSSLAGSNIDAIKSTQTYALATNAANAVSIIDSAINDVSTQRARLGAFQKYTLETTINNLGVTKENLSASESRVRDVDMAAEMMVFTKNQILVQAGTAMLAQANQLPQSVLKLLQG